MTKYFSERTMQRLQYSKELSDRCNRRLLRLHLVYSLCRAFHKYMLMRSFAEFSTHEPASVNKVEKYIDEMNQMYGIDLSVSDYYSTKRTSSDMSILYYNDYKKMQEILKSDIYRLDLSEQLFEEQYEKYHPIPLAEVVFYYYSCICQTLSNYMCNLLSYQECMDRIMTLKFSENQRTMDSVVLKTMIGLGKEWIQRYGELAEAKLNELQKTKKNQQKEERLLSADEVASKLGVSNNTLWRWNKNGYLTHIKVGRKTFYHQSAIDQIQKKI